jgi:hypothetical protein
MKDTVNVAIGGYQAEYERLSRELEIAESLFNEATDPKLIDIYIAQINLIKQMLGFVATMSKKELKTA